MNFKFVRQKLMVGTIVGSIVLIELGMETKAYDIVEDSAYFETKVVQVSEIVEKNYGTFSFGDMEGYTYIYSEPSDEGDWIGKLYDDNWVSVLSIEGEWAEIESGNVKGYVATAYLLEEEESYIRSQELAVSWAYVDAYRLNVRTGPGMDYEVLNVAEFGTELLVLGEEDGWQIVQYGDEICYVSSNYITIEVKFSYAESREEEEQRLEDYERLVEAEEEAVETSSNNITTSSSSEYDSAEGQNVVDYAMQFIGNPYVWGGTDLVNGADCSGFVQSVYAHFGISLPRTSTEQRTAGVSVSYSDIQVGDIICYDGHVGIYIGNNQIVNAIGSKYGIGISSATYSNIITIRRVL